MYNIYIHIYIHTSIGYTHIIEGSLEVKLPTGQMKSRDGKSQRREEKRREEKRREEKKKEDQKEKVSEERRSRCAKR